MLKILSLSSDIKRIEFNDFLNQRVIIQQSLSKTNPTLHFGVIEDCEGNSQRPMVLTIEMLELILPFLIKFALEKILFDKTEKLKRLWERQ